MSARAWLARRIAAPEIRDLTEALRLTQEYVTHRTLPPVEGWSWYDALVKYAPDVAESARRYAQDIEARIVTPAAGEMRTAPPTEETP